MIVLPRHQWTGAQLLSVAQLIVHPATNGGTVSDVTAEDVASALPDVPAWAVFDGNRAAFLVGLWPFDPTIPRGILHVAGTGELPDAWRTVQAFLSALPGVEVMTLTDRPALIRLARRVGLTPLYQQAGFTVLGR